MKSRTMERLDLLAAAREARLVSEIGRHNRALTQAAQQQEILTAYRARLAQGWRAGVVVDAGFARRAGQFVAASRNAEAQIGGLAAQAQEGLNAALQKLAETQASRRALEQELRQAASEARSDAEQRMISAQPLHKPKTGGA